MLIHIVSAGESIEKIADSYHCQVSDITANNQHITDFHHLVAGSKLKIPFLSKDIMETLEETESFISDYYPTYDGALNGKKISQNDSPVEESEEKKSFIEEDSQKIPVKTAAQPESQKIEVEAIKQIKKPKVNSNPANPQKIFGYNGNIVPYYDPKFIRKI